jgi:2-methylisocitrate lyase-like PEP mutase family enzyme
MGKSVRATTRLRELLREPGMIVAPGVADALNARLVAAEGFQAIYMTGGGTSAVRLGMPDVGLLTMPEMVDNAGRIADASGLPVVADADTGYGNALNVQRTVRAYEKAGVAGACISKIRNCPNAAGISGARPSSRSTRCAGRSAPRAMRVRTTIFS